MAAVTAARPSRRKSRRIVSACAFLSNISLDGNVNKEAVNNIKSGVENTTPKPEFSSPGQTSLLHSISKPEPSGSENGESKKVIGRQRSVTEARSDRRPQEIAMVVRRSLSMSESTDSSSTSTTQSANVHKGKHRVTCLMGSSFHLKRKAHDKRIVLCSAHKAPFVTYSLLKYHKENQEAGQEGMGVKKLSTSVPGQCAGIEGVELGSADKTVSYRSFLISKYPFGWSDSLNNQKVSGLLQVQVDAVTVPPLDGADGGASSIAGPYDPHLLDDPELMSGRHRKVLNLTSYLVSMVAYAKPSELKKDLNEQFREKFPSVNITLTKLRSLKREIVKIVTSQDCQLDLTTVAYAFVYFEKLILKEKISKANRKLLAGSCLLLAAKFNDDMKREKIKELIQAIEDRLRVSVKELLKFEFQAVVALEFELHIPQWEVLPHVKRLESEQL